MPSSDTDDLTTKPDNQAEPSAKPASALEAAEPASPPAEPEPSLVDVVSKAMEQPASSGDGASPDPSGASPTDGASADGRPEEEGAGGGADGAEGKGEATTQADGAEGAASDQDTDADGEQDTDQEHDLSEAELAQLKPKVQKRIRRLTRSRAQFRERAEAAEARAQEFAQFEPVQQAITQAGLATNEVQSLVEIGSLVKSGDWNAVIQRLEPVLQHARIRVGEALPADIQRLVDDGEITENVAKELSRTRMEAQQHQAAAQRATTQSQEQQRRAHVTSVQDALNAWESQTAQTVPEYARMKPVVANYVQAIMAQEGFPANADAARKMADRALTQAREHLQSLVPRKEPTPPRPSTAGVGAGKPQAQAPESTLDVVKQQFRSAGLM